MLTITEEGFWRRVDKGDAPDACWNWLGYTNESGYGMVRMRNRPRRAHRVAYEFAYGPIPIGLNVLHSCDNRRCVNPAHLRAGTTADNHRDMWERGRATQGRFNRSKTRCVRGHELTHENTRVSRKTGYRCCKTCERMRVARAG